LKQTSHAIAHSTRSGLRWPRGANPLRLQKLLESSHRALRSASTALLAADVNFQNIRGSTVMVLGQGISTRAMPE
jgi:hypothetical protein